MQLWLPSTLFLSPALTQSCSRLQTGFQKLGLATELRVGSEPFPKTLRAHLLITSESVPFHLQSYLLVQHKTKPVVYTLTFSSLSCSFMIIKSSVHTF